MKKISFFVVFISSVLGVYAQFDFVQKPVENQKINVRNSVNSFTGKLGLAVPLYSYQSARSSLSMGVSLSYSGGGVTMQDRRSVAGTSWQLDAADYGITRVINELPDDFLARNSSGQRKGYMYSGEVAENPCATDYKFAGRRDGWCMEDKNRLDSEADHFYIAAPGLSGMFVIPKNFAPIKTIPQSNLKIQITRFFPSEDKRYVTEIAEFTVITQSGLQYIFNAVEYAKGTQCVMFAMANGGRYCYNGCETTLDAFTVYGWKLTAIKDLNSQDQIVFKYDTYLNNEDDGSVTQNYYKNGYITAANVISGVKNQISQRLKEVTFPGNVNINVAYKTIDDKDIVPEDLMIDKVEIQRGGQKMTYKLRHQFVKNINTWVPNLESNVNNNNLVYPILASVENYINDGAFETIASFSYKKISGQPFQSRRRFCEPPGQSDCYDIYGNWVTPQYVMPYTYLVKPAYPDKNNPGCYIEHAQDESRFAGVLEKVTYSGGGYTEFEYEDNDRYDNASNSTLLPGGLRISKIRQKDAISNTDAVREYVYKTEDGKSSGFGFSVPPYKYFNEMEETNNNFSTIQVHSPFSILPLVKLSGSPVGYKRVEEKLGNGKVVHEFTSFDDFTPLTTSYNYPFASKQRVAEWVYGLPKKQIVYDAVGNIVKKTTNNFNVVITPSVSASTRSLKLAYYKESNIRFGGMGGVCTAAEAYWNAQKDVYNIVNGRVELTSVLNEDFLPNGNVQTNQEMAYDPDLFYPRKTTAYNSLGEKTENFMFYAMDAGAGETDLTNKSLHATPVASITVLTKTDGKKYLVSYNRSRFQTTTEGNKRPFKTLNLRLGRPIRITENIDKYLDLYTFEQKYGLAAKQDVNTTIDKFDHLGNIIQVTNLKANIKESVQHDATGSLVVAKVSNAENNFKLEPLPSSGSAGIILYMGPSNPSANGSTTFVLPVTGDITITAGGVPSSNSSTVSYELKGPSVKTGSLCARGNNSTSCNSSVTFANMPPGTYTLNSSSSTSFTSFSFGLNVNCTYTSVRYVPKYTGSFLFDGFEETDKWDGQLSALDNNQKRTGTASGRIDNPNAGERVCHSTQWLNISLNAAKKFKYSGWVYSNGPGAELFLFMKRANETSYFSYVDQVYAPSVLNKWVYVEKEFTVPADVTQLNIRLDNNGGGTVWFDDIRLHPSDALMTTYTYTALGAMTSETDINNSTIYYEYDMFNRLAIVKDHDKNIIKKICYNYTGDQTNCVANTNPQWQSTGTIRCKPCSANSNYITNMQQHEERDINIVSSSYNTIRWVDDNTAGNCTGIANWQNQGQPYCELNHYYENTGNQLQLQKDLNPCSPTYNTTRPVFVTYNTAACPLAGCNTNNCNGEGYTCINGNCEQGYKVYTSSYYDIESGMFICIYHYEWSDSTWSGNYEEFNAGPCPIQ